MTQQDKGQGSLIVLSGASGVGKSTVIAQLLQKRPDLYFSVSFTTRKPRPGEIDGVNYHFVEREDFEEMIARDEFLEYAEYVGSYYGTSQTIIQEKLDQGVDVLLDIEVQGAAKVKERCPEAVLVFLIPPSFAELSNRLHGRGTDSEEVIAGRLERARREFQEAPLYHYIVVNDEVDHAVEELSAILRAESCRQQKRLYLTKGV